MKKLLFTLVTTLLVFASIAQQTATPTTRLKGHIKGLKDCTVQIYYMVNGENKNDSLQVKDGHFEWNANITEPQKVFIMFPQQYFEFFVEPGSLLLEGTSDAIHEAKVSGSTLQDEAYAFEATIQDIRSQEQELYQKYGKVSETEQRALEERLEELRRQRRARGTEYIKKNPKSRFSLSMVQDRAGMGAYEDIKPVFELLDPSLQNSFVGKQLAERLAVLKRSAIGEQMLDFTQNDMDGKPVRFSNFKGKYVLVDFWASWCGPCRAENPNVLKEYNKYKDKGFTVVGVSLDDNAERWKKAVVDDGMPWTQLSDLQGWKNEVSTYYGIQGIPSTLLVDPNGVIIAKDLRGELLAKKLEEIFNEKI